MTNTGKHTLIRMTYVYNITAYLQFTNQFTYLLIVAIVLFT